MDLFWVFSTLKFDPFIFIFGWSLDKALCVGDIQLWQCFPTSTLAARRESSALNWSIRKIWMLFYGWSFSVFNKMNISMTDTLNHHRIIHANQHFLDKSCHAQSCTSKYCLKRGKQSSTWKKSHLFYNKHIILLDLVGINNSRKPIISKYCLMLSSEPFRVWVQAALTDEQIQD